MIQSPQTQKTLTPFLLFPIILALAGVPAQAAVLVDASGSGRTNSASFNQERQRQQQAMVQMANEEIPTDINTDIRTPGNSTQPRSYHLELDGDYFLISGSYSNGEDFSYQIDLAGDQKYLVYLLPGENPDNATHYSWTTGDWKDHMNSILGILGDALKRNRDPKKEAQIKHAISVLNGLLQNAVTEPPSHSGGSGSFNGYYVGFSGFKGVNFKNSFSTFPHSNEDGGLSVDVQTVSADLTQKFYTFDTVTGRIIVVTKLVNGDMQFQEYFPQEEVVWRQILKTMLTLFQENRNRFYHQTVHDAIDSQIEDLEEALASPVIPYGQPIYNHFGEYAYSVTINADGTATIFDGFRTYQGTYSEETGEVFAYSGADGDLANRINVKIFYDAASRTYQISRFAEYSHAGEGENISQGFRIVDYDFNRHVMNERTLSFSPNPNFDILRTSTDWIYGFFNGQWRPVERHYSYLGPAQWYYGAEPLAESIREKAYYVRDADGEILRTVITNYSSATRQTQTSLGFGIDGYNRSYYIFDEGNTTAQYNGSVDSVYAEAHADQKIDSYVLGQGFDGFYTARLHYKRDALGNLQPSFAWVIVNGLPRRAHYVVGEWDYFTGGTDDIAVPFHQLVLDGKYETFLGGAYYGYHFSQLRIIEPYISFSSTTSGEHIILQGYPENDTVVLDGKTYRVRLQDGQFILDLI